MSFEYPKNTIWYLQSWRDESEDPAEGSAVAIRLQQKGKPETAETYLLTCAHVVRGEYGGSREIRAWPPGYGGGPDQARVVSVVPEIKDLPGDDRIAADDWTILRINDGNVTSAGYFVKAWAGASAPDEFHIWGYPGGKDSYQRGVVTPTPIKGKFAFRDLDFGVLRLIGDATRKGVSGGGVFRVNGGELAGLHRARFDAALQLHAVSAAHIFQILEERGYEATSRAPDILAADDDVKPIDLEPFIAQIVKQLSSEPFALVRLEEQFKRRKLQIEQSRLGASATQAQSKADALARTIIERDFSQVAEAMTDAIEECSTLDELHQRQVLFNVFCWFLPAYDPKKAESLRELYEKGDTQLIEVEVASALAAELVVAAWQRRCVDITKGEKDQLKGTRTFTGQSLPKGLGATPQEEVIESVEHWLINLLMDDPDYDHPAEVYRPSIQKILLGLNKPGKMLPYIVFSMASLKRGLKREDLGTISTALRGIYPKLATLILSNDSNVHEEEPARLYSIREFLKGYHK